MPDDVVADWQSEGAKQVIAQAELLPVLVARVHFAAYLAGRSVLVFIDNESARGALIKSTSPNKFSTVILEKIVGRDIKEGTLTWYARVPTASNIADPPSRGRVPPMLPGWPAPAQVQVAWQAVWS